MMNNFLLFVGSNYYPDGGWGDYHGEHPSLEEAMAAGKDSMNVYSGNDWWHVVDLTEKAVVKFGNRSI